MLETWIGDGWGVKYCCCLPRARCSLAIHGRERHVHSDGSFLVHDSSLYDVLPFCAIKHAERSPNRHATFSMSSGRS